MNELKTIPNFENYAITRDGRVWSKPRRGQGCNLLGRWLIPIKRSDGHLTVSLWKNNCGYIFLVHRLVLETFVGPCPPGMECRHLNGNPTNNHLCNLKWGTHKENIRDAMQHGTHNCLYRNRVGENNGHNIMTGASVKVIRYLRNVAKFSVKDLMWHFGIGRTTVKDICRYKTWQHII